MKTEEIEAHLRETLHAKATQITEADLSVDPMAHSSTRLRPQRPRVAPRVLTAAAAVILVVGLVGVALTGQSPDAADQPHIADQPQPGGAAGLQRAWPLNGDEPLGGHPAGAHPEPPASTTPPDPDYALQTPEDTARSYMTQVIGLPEDWGIQSVVEDRDTAVAKYILQDVPSDITMARTTEGFWYVTGANTDLAAPGRPVITAKGLDLSVAPGPRVAGRVLPLVATVLKVDGSLLVSATGAIPPPQPEGAAGDAHVWMLEWAEPELAAAVRIDVLDDHDADPSTAEVTIGHWTTGLAPPALSGPAGFDPLTAGPVFSADGSADAVADAYMRDRFPDHPNPGITLDPARFRGRRAYANWSTGDNGQPIATGVLALRESGEGWSVVAASTNGVDLSAVEVTDGRLSGRVTTDNANALFADVFQPDGTPAAGSPRPDGQPGAAYRFGTAGGPGDGSLDIDVPVDPGSAVLRVNLVGGTILSISELRLVVPTER